MWIKTSESAEDKNASYAQKQFAYKIVSRQDYHRFM